MLDPKTWVLAALGAMAAAPVVASSANEKAPSAVTSTPIPAESPHSTQDPGKNEASSQGKSPEGATAQTAPATSDQDGPTKAAADPEGLPLPKLGKGELQQSVECLALNIYHEARAEPEKGQHAVAAVTLNRVASPAFPNSICKVVKQGGKKRNGCQFSWWCDRHPDQPRETNAWERALALSRKTLSGEISDPTDGALYYHASRVKPRWARTFERTGTIGQHLFYKPQGA